MDTKELLEKLEPQIQFLGNTFKIPGMDRNDIKQELRLRIVDDVNKMALEEREKYNEGWWFLRLKWSLINLLEKEGREPINRSVRIDWFGENGGK